MLGRVRLILWVLVAVAAAVGLYLAVRPAEPPIASTSDGGMSDIGGPFTLVGSDGKPFASARLNGRPAAIFFGFTHCPDVCPTTLARLARLRKQLGGDDRFSIVFITVDPERDGPAEVGQYTALFGTPVVGLTGTVAEVERVKTQFGIYSAKVPGAGGNYSMDHTATVLLLDRNGRFAATIAPDEGDQAALAKLKRLAA